MSDKTLVKYIGNADNYNKTSVLVISDDSEREDIPLGDSGYLTDDEIANARRFGLILVPAKAASELTKDELISELGELGQTVKTSDSQKQLAQQLEDARAKAVASTTADTPATGGTGDSVSSAVATGSTTTGTAGNTGSAS